jgi:hypothetical protein
MDGALLAQKAGEALALGAIIEPIVEKHFSKLPGWIMPYLPGVIASVVWIPMALSCGASMQEAIGMIITSWGTAIAKHDFQPATVIPTIPPAPKQ